MALMESLFDLIEVAAAEMAQQGCHAYKLRTNPPGQAYKTLRPGRHTPLWNELRAQLRPLLRPHGSQAQLARLLGLPRQQINAYITSGTRMPDAERTLQLLAWLMACRLDRRPS